MKAIFTLLLLIILGIVGYNFYTNWKRFNPPNYQYKTDVVVDANHSDKALLLDYYQAIERLNGYVITQWTTNEIDVRNPEDDDEDVLAAVTEYRDRIGVVKFYEAQLLAPKRELVKETAAQQKSRLIQELFMTNPAGNTFRLGERSALVFEIQKLLNKKGDSIKIDGLFNTETKGALQAFEQKNGLFADGKLDKITLEYLLQ